MPPSRITDFFKQATPEERAESAARSAASIRQARAWMIAQEQSAMMNREARSKALAAARQRKHRDRQREVEVKLGLRDSQTHRKIKPMQLRQPSPDRPGTPSPSGDPEPAANTSDSTKSPRKTRRRQKRRARTNWMEPVRWAIISHAAKLTGFSPQGIVHECQRGPSGDLFKTLDRGTVGAWINEEGNGWTEPVLDRVKRSADAASSKEAPRKAHDGSKLGRPSILSPYPGLVDDVVKYLKIARAAGALITRTIAHSTILGFIQSQAPALLQNPKFKFSDSFVRRFLINHLDWSYRTTTQTTQKLPTDWLTQCTDMAMRLAWYIGHYQIPAELIINADQTGVAYLGTGDKTWEIRGADQVPATGKGDKRQFTLMVAIAASGTMLPWQAIFKGKTHVSLPSQSSRAECEKKGFCFACGGEKHWSNLSCLKRWILEILMPHVDMYCRSKGLRPNQKAVLLLDCWSVHRGEEFRTWMRMNCPRVILLFIPGGCTGVAQPCDIGINRPLKHQIKLACVNYLAAETQRQLSQGRNASSVTIDLSPGTLRNACTSWLQSAWEWFIDHPDVIKKSWSRATFRDVDLSYETLSGKRFQSIVDERFSDDVAFALSVCNANPCTNGSTVEEDVDGPDYDDDLTINPCLLSDIPQSLPRGIEYFEGSLVVTRDEESSDDECSDVGDSDDMEL